MAENKVRFLRGTAAEYASAVKDKDTFYYTTDDEKFYVGSKEITGGGITVDSALSNTSTNPVQNKVIKAAIDDKADKTIATTDTDGLMSAMDKTKLDNADDTYALKSKYGDSTINVGRKAGSAVGEKSTAEGENTIASGYFSHAEGIGATASGNGSHAEGGGTIASDSDSHAEGYNTIASGHASHAEGLSTVASGQYSHAEGENTIANNKAEHASGKYNVSNEDTLFSVGDGTDNNNRHNAFEITKTGGKLHDKDIATTDMSLPANGGNADTVDGRHCGRIATLDSNGNYWNSKAEDINDAYLQWDGSKYFSLKTYGENLTHVDDSDTVDGLHADDFVKSFKQNFDLPSNVDVPTWIYQNAKIYTLYRTHSSISGLTNVPNNSTDYVWYWFDGVNIIAREYGSGRYYICDVINGSFSGWKDVYTSGYKPYVTGVVVVDSNGKVNVSFGFKPSFVLYAPTSPKSGIFDSVYITTTSNETGFTPSADTYTGGLTGNGFSYIAFK